MSIYNLLDLSTKDFTVNKKEKKVFILRKLTLYKQRIDDGQGRSSHNFQIVMITMKKIKEGNEPD